MVKEFTVCGEPQGKGRPRFVSGRKPYTPQETRSYEDDIKYTYVFECKEQFPIKMPIRMTIKAYYGIPKNTPKRKRALMEFGDTRPTKKPDLDNIAKVYADALNGTAYHDDAQIVSLICEKYYSVKPRVEVRLENIEGGNRHENSEIGTCAKDK
jgi:Holliday junction resolvase RusA-like endonuclease